MPRSRTGCSLWAYTGCGCGLIAMLGILFLFLLLGLQFARERRDPTMNRKAYSACMKNLIYLGLAIDSYQKDNRRIPDRLEQLDPRYLDSSERLRCPLDLPGQRREYEYFPQSTKPTDPLIVCRRHGYGPLILLHNGKLAPPNENYTKFARPK
ncbi:MAG: hypothetical protein ACYC7E_03535 [Armatimonadota bacterium]